MGRQGEKLVEKDSMNVVIAMLMEVEPLIYFVVVFSLFLLSSKLEHNTFEISFGWLKALAGVHSLPFRDSKTYRQKERERERAFNRVDVVIARAHVECCHFMWIRKFIFNETFKFIAIVAINVDKSIKHRKNHQRNLNHE